MVDCTHTRVKTAPELRFPTLAFKPAAACILAFLLLLTTTLALNPSLHEFLHHDGAGGEHTCLACSFAKAVFVAALTVFAGVLLNFFGDGLCRRPVLLELQVAYRSSHSRAPPLS